MNFPYIMFKLLLNLKHKAPVQKEIEPGHYVVCHLYDHMKDINEK